MSSLSLPLYYIASRNLNDDQIAIVQRVLQFTPVNYAVTSDPADTPLAATLATDVVRFPDDKAAELGAAQLSEETGSPVVLVGDAEVLDVVYAGGRKDRVPCEC